jgi:hypothetical protein
VAEKELNLLEFPDFPAPTPQNISVDKANHAEYRDSDHAQTKVATVD